MNIYKSSLVLLTGSILISTITLAAPVVTFQGEVAAQTCQATINGQTNGIVLLPTVSVGEFTAKNNTAGLTPFTISISGCSGKDPELKIGTKFLGRNVTSTGNLGNLASVSPAKNVAIQLTQTAAGTVPVVLNGITKVDGLILPLNQASTSHQFGARYIVDEGTIPTPGAITAVAEYTISYQ